MELMSPTITLIPVDEYLRLNCKPACEYRDGILTQKPMPTWKHSAIQMQIGHVILGRYPDFRPGGELHVRLRERRYLVPDVAIVRKDRIQEPYPTEPIHVCVEILSPEDRLSDVIAKGEEYHAWGVPMVWIVDPEKRAAWEFSRAGGLHEIPLDGSLTAPEIAVPLAEIFAVL